MAINILNYNTVLSKHFVSLVKGNIPASVKGLFEDGETFEHAHQQTCQELESTVPDKKKREALVTLMGKNGCPLCVIIIKENPNLYKAVFPHFIMHKENFNYMLAPAKPRVAYCPMLNHLPKEIRTT